MSFWFYWLGAVFGFGGVCSGFCVVSLVLSGCWWWVSLGFGFDL